MTKKKKKPKISKKFWIIGIITLIVFVVGFFYVLKSDVVFRTQEISYDVKANVTEFLQEENETIRIGVSTDTDQLNFGVIPLNLSVRKVLKFNNREPRPIKVNLIVYGELSEFIEFQNNGFLVQPLSTREVEVGFYGKEAGDYTGEIKIIIKTPKYDFAVPLLMVA